MCRVAGVGEVMVIEGLDLGRRGVQPQVHLHRRHRAGLAEPSAPHSNLERVLVRRFGRQVRRRKDVRVGDAVEEREESVGVF
jgi:hypothetical protein